MQKTKFQPGDTVKEISTGRFGKINMVMEEEDGSIFYVVDFDDKPYCADLLESELDFAQKWKIELNSVIEFPTPLGYTEDEAVAMFFEELSYIGEPLEHSYEINEVKDNE